MVIGKWLAVAVDGGWRQIGGGRQWTVVVDGCRWQSGAVTVGDDGGILTFLPRDNISLLWEC